MRVLFPALALSFDANATEPASRSATDTSLTKGPCSVTAGFRKPISQLDQAVVLGAVWGAVPTSGWQSDEGGIYGLQCYEKPDTTSLFGVPLLAVDYCFDRSHLAAVVAYVDMLRASEMIRAMKPLGPAVKNPVLADEVYWCGTNVGAGVFVMDKMAVVILEHYASIEQAPKW